MTPVGPPVYTGALRPQEGARCTCHEEEAGESLWREGMSDEKVHEELMSRSSGGGLEGGTSFTKEVMQLSGPHLSRMDAGPSGDVGEDL